MDASEISSLFTVYQGGGMSFESFFYALRDRGVHNETLTLEEEQARLKVDEEKAAERNAALAGKIADTNVGKAGAAKQLIPQPE